MTIIDDYLDYQEKYTKEYNENTLVLMQVGHFYEAYAVDNDNESIMHIGGSNSQDGIIRGSGSYYFSAITGIWGWAKEMFSEKDEHPRNNLTFEYSSLPLQKDIHCSRMLKLSLILKLAVFDIDPRDSISYSIFSLFKIFLRCSIIISLVAGASLK